MAKSKERKTKRRGIGEIVTRHRNGSKVREYQRRDETTQEGDNDKTSNSR